MTASAKIEDGKVVALDYSGNARTWDGWLPLVDRQPDFDPKTQAVGVPTMDVRGREVVAVYTVTTLPAPPVRIPPLSADEITRLRVILGR